MQNAMALECFENLETAMQLLTNSADPLGYDEPQTENAVNKVINDFLVSSVRGEEPKSIKIVVHNALAKFAVEETQNFCDRTGRAADARETIEKAIEAELH